MLEYEHLSPATQKKVDGLVAANGWTFEQAMEEIVIEGIAMGGLTSADDQKRSWWTSMGHRKGWAKSGPKKTRISPGRGHKPGAPQNCRGYPMSYGNKTHRNTHQLKSRLNDDAYADLKAEAKDRAIQPGALVRELTLAALQFKQAHGYFPLVDDQELEGGELDNFPALRELARTLNMQPRELVHDLVRQALALKLKHEQLSLFGDKKFSA